MELVEGADVITDELSSDTQGQIKITLSNYTVATLHDVSVPGVSIVWNFTPIDDPDARAAHKAWVFGDKKLEKNRVWYCSNIFPKIPGDDRQAVDKSVASEVYGWDTKQNHYCLRD